MICIRQNICINCSRDNSNLIKVFIRWFNNGNVLKKIDGSGSSDKVSAIPHPVSKLRLFNYAIPTNETEYERKFRERKIQIQNFNHDYWCRINSSFKKVLVFNFVSLNSII